MRPRTPMMEDAMRIKIMLIHVALLAALAGCASGSPNSDRAAIGSGARSDGLLAPAGGTHLPPVWADPEFIKS